MELSLGVRCYGLPRNLVMHVCTQMTIFDWLAMTAWSSLNLRCIELELGFGYDNNLHIPGMLVQSAHRAGDILEWLNLKPLECASYIAFVMNHPQWCYRRLQCCDQYCSILVTMTV